MKYLLKFTKLLVYGVIILLAMIFIVEYSRMQQAQQDMQVYIKIAANYAITSTQDISDETANTNMKNTLRVDGLYHISTYSNYLSALNNFTSGATTVTRGDRKCQEKKITSNGVTYTYDVTYLKSCYDILAADYIIASNKASSVGSSYLDGFMTVTPLSFNLPYLSDDVVSASYSYALKEMIKNNSYFGTSGIWLGSTDSYVRSKLKVNGSGYDPAKLTYAGDFSYMDANTGAHVRFSIVPLTNATLRSVYGNTSYYDDLLNYLKNLDTNKYEDTRYAVRRSDGGGGAQTAMMKYDVNFNTDWYFVTNNVLLRASSNATYNLNKNRTGLFNQTENLHLYNGTDNNVWAGTSIGKREMIPSSNYTIANGQLMILASRKSGSTYNSYSSTSVSYMLIG